MTIFYEAPEWRQSLSLKRVPVFVSVVLLQNVLLIPVDVQKSKLIVKKFSIR